MESCRESIILPVPPINVSSAVLVHKTHDFFTAALGRVLVRTDQGLFQGWREEVSETNYLKVMIVDKANRRFLVVNLNCHRRQRVAGFVD